MIDVRQEVRGAGEQAAAVCQDLQGPRKTSRLDQLFCVNYRADRQPRFLHRSGRSPGGATRNGASNLHHISDRVD